MRPLSRAAYLDTSKEFYLLATGLMQQPEEKKNCQLLVYDEPLESASSHSL